MGHRLSKIYTRTGDDGTTGISNGSRLPKDHPRVAVMGSVDELNATLGMVLAEAVPKDVREVLSSIQHELFDLGAELSCPVLPADEEATKAKFCIQTRAVTWLEETLDHYNEQMSPLQEFILPGGTRAAATCHLARTVCRRAERELVTLAHTETVNPNNIAYLNRLSDLLFVLARVLNDYGRDDVLWQPGRHLG
ncbi:MAG: cob(I)yrinic acid a,c-diamide adenosyltransferase [Pseudomonadota bacterium]